MSASGWWIFKNPGRRNLNRRKLRSLKQRTAPLRIRGNACTQARPARRKRSAYTIKVGRERKREREGGRERENKLSEIQPV